MRPAPFHVVGRRAWLGGQRGGRTFTRVGRLGSLVEGGAPGHPGLKEWLRHGVLRPEKMAAGVAELGGGSRAGRDGMRAQQQPVHASAGKGGFGSHG